jgi:hypothetical protein
MDRSGGNFVMAIQIIHRAVIKETFGADFRDQNRRNQRALRAVIAP